MLQLFSLGVFLVQQMGITPSFCETVEDVDQRRGRRYLRLWVLVHDGR
jgi:hypothetical protein